MYKKYVKHPLDIVVSIIILIISFPILIVLFLILGLHFKTFNVFFTQERPGLNNEIFKLYKLKTMLDTKDSDGYLLPDKQRLTKLGKLIRKTSLDELPQLVNVIKGEMSLIGPRPLKVHNLLLYTPYQIRRHEVKPGITGWAQVHGRNAIKLSRKFEMDVYYVDNLSFTLDFKIYFLTLKSVLFRSGIGNASDTMEEIDDLDFMIRLEKLGKFKE